MQSYGADLGITRTAGTAPQIIALTGTGSGTLSIDTPNPSGWVVTNGALTLHWNSVSGHVFGVYIDWWITVPSNATGAFTTSRHFILTANDTGFHGYSTADHSVPNN